MMMAVIMIIHLFERYCLLIVKMYMRLTINFDLTKYFYKHVVYFLNIGKVTGSSDYYTKMS